MRRGARLSERACPAGTEPRAASVGRAVAPDGVATLVLAGEWLLNAPVPSPPTVTSQLFAARSPTRVILDGSGIRSWDSALLAFIRRIEADCRAHRVPLDWQNLPDGVTRLLALAGPVEASGQAPPRRSVSLAASAGRGVLGILAGGAESVSLVGELAIGFARLLRAAADLRRRDLFALIQQCGADAVPIVIIISLLVGMTFAFVAAIQLAKFGAAIYVADLVTIAMLREMGPMMTGIVLAGRTGAAFAAQIATMQGNEEIDALSTLGIRPAEFLVLPRVLALAAMMPVLCLYADASGIFGGFLVGSSSLNVTTESYMLETAHAATMTNLVIGLVKSFVFGVLVGFTGCRRGLAAARSAAGVGEATTSAVVTSILLIIIADSLFAVALNVLGI